MRLNIYSNSDERMAQMKSSDRDVCNDYTRIIEKRYNGSLGQTSPDDVVFSTTNMRYM